MQTMKHASEGSRLALKPQGFQWPHKKDRCFQSQSALCEQAMITNASTRSLGSVYFYQNKN